ncbi:helicase [Candidatus Parcubacteria bacterium]|nr:MAG: helicase [Candidatus Parcubacteria bacterium]
MTQEEAFAVLKMGHSVYLTGSAGSGKTFLLNKYIDYLRKHNAPVAVTASTGIAATHMNGVTIHSWSGIGIKNQITDRDISEIEGRKYLWDRFQNTKVLIIDEVSMLHHFRLDLAEKIVRKIRRVDAPFGGMQVVLCGDFFQLPPVARTGEPEAHFIYKSEAWQKMNPRICYLHEQHRQKDDTCLKVLNDIRSNTVSEETLDHLRGRYKKEPKNSIQPTRLYTHNADVDEVNDRELNGISGEERVFRMGDKGKPHLLEALKKSCLAPEILKLKRGARVMFVKNNHEQGYVNGTLGKIVGFHDDGPMVETAGGERIAASPVSWAIEEEGKIKAEISQVPLRLAWAITVHKSQGMSLDAVEVDLSKSFERGMGYVALSRVRTLDGLKLLGLNQMALKVNEDILEFDKELKDHSDRLSDELKRMPGEEKTRAQETYLASIAPKEKYKGKKKKLSTCEITRCLALDKKSVKEMAIERNMTEGTIISHLEKLAEEGMIDPKSDIGHIKPCKENFEKIKAAFDQVYKKTGEMKLSPARDILGPSFSFDEIRMARLFMRK